ncbi:uncharacterized protein LOC143362034 [Halictus rubicundus]|uniref:uncharacterized protein LOC143362034 n=1 Tax=Halictus rubicundus TaxID=77578 RepID=UPI0040364FB6
MEQTLNLLALNKFLHQTLAFTEKVKNILKSDCEEAMFSLKPWCKKTVTKQENSGNSCTCIKSETEVEEIATNISRTLLQTQQLREKLSSNVIKGKKYFKQSSVSEIYNPYAPGISNNNKSPFIETRNTNKTNEKTKNDTKPPVTKSGKATGDKNFLAINKRSIKNITEIKKHKNIIYKLENNFKSNCSIAQSEYVKLDRKSGAASTIELKSLIEKISSHSSSSIPNTNDGNCPIHGSITSQIIYKHNFIAMDVVDSIKEFNIPGEIIKPLKAYHAYLSSGFSDKPSDNRKRQKMCNLFLIEFNKLDNIIQNESLDKSDNVVLLSNFISEFSNFFLEYKEMSASTNLGKTYAKLNLMWKQYDAKKFDNLQIWKSHVQETLFHNRNIVGSMSNGIWNLEFNLRYFKEIQRVQCVPYANKNRLLSFFEMIQQLQQIKYFKDLVNILLKEVLPNVTTSFDSTKPEYIKIYKMMYILHQGLNPKMPVLVRTD